MGRLRIKRRQHSPLVKRAKKGLRGYPVATVAFYGPDNRRASKVALGIILGEHQETAALERWFSEEGDVRFDRSIGEAIIAFISKHGAQSVVVADGIMGCPHEEGIDYPAGKKCPAVSVLGNAGSMDRRDHSVKTLGPNNAAMNEHERCRYPRSLAR